MSVRPRMTVADLERMNPPPFEESHTSYEIIDGELHVSTQPHYYHQQTSGLISYRLPNRSLGTGAGIVVCQAGVIFAPDDAVAPDVAWFANQERHDAAAGVDGKYHSAPDLVVEVLSPGRENEERDREHKLGVYTRHRVSEYWIADWRTRTIEVYLRQDDALRLVAKLGPDDTIESPLLPGFSAVVRDLFPPAS